MSIHSRLGVLTSPCALVVGWRADGGRFDPLTSAAQRLPNLRIVYADDLGDSFTRRAGKNVRPAGGR